MGDQLPQLQLYLNIYSDKKILIISKHFWKDNKVTNGQW